MCTLSSRKYLLLYIWFDIDIDFNRNPPHVGTEESFYRVTTPFTRNPLLADAPHPYYDWFT